LIGEGGSVEIARHDFAAWNGDKKKQKSCFSTKAYKTLLANGFPQYIIAYKLHLWPVTLK
jgi:hypothetical protein